MLTFPEDGLDIIVIANGARAADVSRLAEKVADILLADRLGPETPTISADEFKSALGDYWSPESRMTYSLVDEGGVLKLAVAKSPGGTPLVRADDGRLICPGGGIGEIAIKPAGEALEIRFGLETPDVPTARGRPRRRRRVRRRRRWASTAARTPIRWRRLRRTARA